MHLVAKRTTCVGALCRDLEAVGKETQKSVRFGRNLPPGLSADPAGTPAPYPPPPRGWCHKGTGSASKEDQVGMAWPDTGGQPSLPEISLHMYVFCWTQRGCLLTLKKRSPLLSSSVDPNSQRWVAWEGTVSGSRLRWHRRTVNMVELAF